MQTTLRTLTVTWPLVIFLLLPALTRAETAVEAWVQRYDGLGNYYDLAYAVAVDASNNVIVTGYSSGSGGDLDYATIKYSSAGVSLWTNRYNGPGNGSAYAGGTTALLPVAFTGDTLTASCACAAATWTSRTTWSARFTSALLLANKCRRCQSSNRHSRIRSRL